MQVNRQESPTHRILQNRGGKVKNESIPSLDVSEVKSQDEPLRKRPETATSKNITKSAVRNVTGVNPQSLGDNSNLQS